MKNNLFENCHYSFETIITHSITFPFANFFTVMSSASAIPVATPDVPVATPDVPDTTDDSVASDSSFADKHLVYEWLESVMRPDGRPNHRILSEICFDAAKELQETGCLSVTYELPETTARMPFGVPAFELATDFARQIRGKGLMSVHIHFNSKSIVITPFKKSQPVEPIETFETSQTSETSETSQIFRTPERRITPVTPDAPRRPPALNRTMATAQQPINFTPMPQPMPNEQMMPPMLIWTAIGYMPFYQGIGIVKQ